MDRIGADAIVRPRTTEEVAAILRLCNETGQPVVVQGGMSGWVRATETRRGEIALSLERMAAIEAIDPVNRTATVEAGVILETVSYTHLRAHETVLDLVCRLLLDKKKNHTIQHT